MKNYKHSEADPPKNTMLMKKGVFTLIPSNFVRLLFPRTNNLYIRARIIFAHWQNLYFRVGLSYEICVEEKSAKDKW